MEKYNVLIDEESALRLYNMAIIGFSIIFFVIVTSYQAGESLLGVPYPHLLCGIYSTIIFLNFSYISDRLYKGDVITLLLDPPRVRKVFELGITLIMMYVLYVALHDFADVWSIPEDLLLLYSVVFSVYVIYFLINVFLIFGSIIHGLYVLYLVAKLYEYASRLQLKIVTQQVLLYVGIMLYIICAIYGMVVPYKKIEEFNTVVAQRLTMEQTIGRDVLVAIAGRDITPRDLPSLMVSMSSAILSVELIDKETFKVKKVKLGRSNVNVDYTMIFNPERYMIGDIFIYMWDQDRIVL